MPRLRSDERRWRNPQRRFSFSPPERMPHLDLHSGAARCSASVNRSCASPSRYFNGTRNVAPPPPPPPPPRGAAPPPPKTPPREKKNPRAQTPPPRRARHAHLPVGERHP